MPTDAFSAILYVFLLVPGLVYTRQIERRRSYGKMSAFRETATVVVASSAALLTSWIFVILLSTIPVLNPWVNAMMADPDGVRAENPLVYSGCIILILALAVTFGFIGGQPRINQWIARIGSHEDDVKLYQSGWTVAFDTKGRKIPVIVSVQLKNGDWLQGPIDHWNQSPDETPDRSFTLKGPIWFRSSTAEIDELLDQDQAVVISAAEIEYLTVAEDPAGAYEAEARLIRAQEVSP